METQQQTFTSIILMMFTNYPIVTIGIILSAICLLVAVIFLVFRYLRDFENVELGPLKFKTKSKHIKEEKSESETHKDTIILEIVHSFIRKRLYGIIIHTIEKYEKISQLKNELECILKSSSDMSFDDIRKEFTQLFNSYIEDIKNKDIQFEQTVRETTYLEDLLKTYEKEWKVIYKDIINRGGFEQLVLEKNLTSMFINELFVMLDRCVTDIFIPDSKQLRDKLLEYNIAVKEISYPKLERALMELARRKLEYVKEIQEINDYIYKIVPDKESTEFDKYIKVLMSITLN